MTSHETKTGARSGSGPSRTRTGWWVAVAFAVLGVVVVHLVALIGGRGPVLYSDALGYLGNARFLAGGAPPTFDGSFSYSPGYSVVLLPLYWFTQHPDVIWAGAVLMNVGFATLIMAPSYRLARAVFTLGRSQALLSSVAVSLTPALILQPGRIWVETLFPLVFMFALVAVLSLFATRRAIPAVSSGLLVGYLVSIHGRGIAIAGALVAILLLGVLWRRLPPAKALLAVGSMGAVAIGDLALRSYLRGELWNAAEVPLNTGSATRIIGAYAPDQLIATLSTALGHLWYVITVSFGVAAVGVVALALLVARSPRWRRASRPAQACALFALLAVAGVVFLSAGLLTNVNRVDHRVYGRYLEGVTPILVLAGTASLLKVRSAWRMFAYGAVMILVAGLALYWVRGSEEFVGNVQKFTIPGLLGMQAIVDPSNGVFLDRLNIPAISVLATVIGVAAAFVIRRRPTLGVVGVIALTVGLTFFGKVTSWDPFASFWYEAYANIPAALHELSEGRPVAYDLEFLNPDARNLYEFEMAPRRLTFIDDVCEADPGSAVISTHDPTLTRFGGTQIASDGVPEQGLWLINGDPPASCG